MKLDTFFENFGLLADAPNGVQKLREMILQLAVQGKLVPQDPNDQPASVLLEKIRAEKKQLVKENKIKKGKPLPSIDSDDIPYSVPKGWTWASLAEIGQINPRNELDDETEVSFVPMKLVPTVLGDSVESEIRQWGDIKKGFTHFSEGDVALAKITPCFQNRKSAVMRGLKNGFGAGTTELHIFRPINDLIISEHVLLYLKTPKLIREGVSKMTGSAGQKRVPKTYFSETPFPLPPTNEQKRIVVKVDELMTLCDKLETRKKQVSINCIQLNDASIHKLLTASESNKFRKHWQRICDNFDLLYSKPENVNKLRQAILQLAVQGKLVQQDPKDEPASVLLEKIKAEKEQLIKEKKIKQPKLLPPIKSDETPYAIPDGWEWLRLGLLCETITKGSSPKWQGVNYVDSRGGILFITSENVGNYYLKLDKTKYVEEQFNKIEPRSILKKNDILMNIVGASIGRTAIFDLEEVTNINQAVCLIRLLNPNRFFELKYFLYFFNSSVCIGYMFDKQVDNARANLSMTNISQFAIPIPPKNEQKRIVAKIDKLMAFCDELEASLSKSQTDCDRLMEAAVAGIMAA